VNENEKARVPTVKNVLVMYQLLSIKNSTDGIDFPNGKTLG
jgi:hypothetical protein